VKTSAQPKDSDSRQPENQRQRGETLTRLIRLFEDYAVRRCWPQEEGGQHPTLSIEPALVFDLSDEKARAVRVDPGNDGRILTELRKFEKVYLAATIPHGVQDEVDYCVWSRSDSKNWRLCAQSTVRELRQKGYECIENIWNTPLEQFPDLLWGLIRWQLEQPGLRRLWFLTSPERRERIETACETPVQEQSTCASLLKHARVLPYPDHVGGFAFLDAPERPPQENEQMLLLYTREGRADLFQWSQGKFTGQSLTAEQAVDLSRVNRLAVCSDVLERPPEGTLLFRSVDAILHRAVAHYVMWQPALDQWEMERRRQRVQQLQRHISQLESENRALRAVVQRARRILGQLSANPTLNTGGSYDRIRN